MTAVLFELGKLVIGIYVGKQALDPTYGAAASLVVILIWIYYTSQIVLIGAEFTHRHAVWRRQRAGLPPGPSQYLTESGIADLPVPGSSVKSQVSARSGNSRPRFVFW